MSRKPEAARTLRQSLDGLVAVHLDLACQARDQAEIIRHARVLEACADLNRSIDLLKSALQMLEREPEPN